jgi:hypothetical protein
MEEWHPLWGMEQWPSPGAPFHQTWRILQTKPWRLLLSMFLLGQTCRFLCQVNQRPVIILSVVAGGMAAAQGEKKRKRSARSADLLLPAEERARECVLSKPWIDCTVKTVQNCRVSRARRMPPLPSRGMGFGICEGQSFKLLPSKRPASHGYAHHPFCLTRAWFQRADPRPHGPQAYLWSSRKTHLRIQHPTA